MKGVWHNTAPMCGHCEKHKRPGSHSPLWLVHHALLCFLGAGISEIKTIQKWEIQTLSLVYTLSFTPTMISP